MTNDSKVEIVCDVCQGKQYVIRSFTDDFDIMERCNQCSEFDVLDEEAVILACKDGILCNLNPPYYVFGSGPNRKPYPGIFILAGWRRFAARNLIKYKEYQNFLIEEREKGRDSILVDEDELACQYQRLEFRINRVKFALNSFGILSSVAFKDGVWHHKSRMELIRINKQSIHHYRLKAHNAVQILKSINPKWNYPLPSGDLVSVLEHLMEKYENQNLTCSEY